MPGQWNEYQKLVLSELERLTGEVKDLRNKIESMNGDLIALKVKAGLWGGGAGAAVGLLAWLGN